MSRVDTGSGVREPAGGTVGGPPVQCAGRLPTAVTHTPTIRTGGGGESLAFSKTVRACQTTTTLVGEPPVSPVAALKPAAVRARRPVGLPFRAGRGLSVCPGGRARCGSSSRGLQEPDLAPILRRDSPQ